MSTPRRRVVLNGRFLSQDVTGVQRSARELVRALDDLVDAGDPAVAGLALEVVAPRAAQGDLPLRRIPVRREGSTRSHAWEQLVLPGLVGRDLLVSFANMGPLALRRQLVVIHDAGVWGVPYAYSAPFRAWYRAVTPTLARRARAVVTVSEFSRRELARHIRVGDDRLSVVPNGSDHVLRAAPDRAVLERHDLGGVPYILTVGTAAAHKNLGLVARALAAPELTALRLAVVGGAAARVFAATADAPSAEGLRALSLGRVSDAELRALYERALCLVLPSRYEGFGLPAVEAMACGCPVLAARAGALPEVCGDAALYFDPDDSAELARLLARLHGDTGERQARARAGREHARRYSWQSSARALAQRIGEEVRR